MSSTNANQSKAQRREAARAQALELKKKQEAADRRSRRITMSVLGAVLAVLVGIVVWLFVRDHRNNAAYQIDENLPLSEVADVPANTLPSGGIAFTAQGAAGADLDESVPTVGVFFDYMCPACGQFEQANESELHALLDDGTANVVLYPVAILDRASQGSQYSTRAAAALGWIAERAPEQALAFHAVLFANEAEQNTPGWSDEEIADFATSVGVPEDVAAGIASGEARRTFGQWVASVTAQHTADPSLHNENGGFGTPTITIDGERWTGNWAMPDALGQAVADATR